MYRPRHQSRHVHHLADVDRLLRDDNLEVYGQSIPMLTREGLFFRGLKRKTPGCETGVFHQPERLRTRAVRNPETT